MSMIELIGHLRLSIKAFRRAYVPGTGCRKQVIYRRVHKIIKLPVQSGPILSLQFQGKTISIFHIVGVYLINSIADMRAGR